MEGVGGVFSDQSKSRVPSTSTRSDCWFNSQKKNEERSLGTWVGRGEVVLVSITIQVFQGMWRYFWLASLTGLHDLRQKKKIYTNYNIHV